MSQQLDQSALNARNYLIVMFVSLCLLDATLIILSRDRWAIGRILATVLVMYCVLQGYKWAKWLFVGICSLSIVPLSAMLIVLSSRLSPILMIGSLWMILLSVVIPIYLIRSQDLNRYFAYKRHA